MKARCRNEFGWGNYGPNLVTRFISAPKPITDLSISENCSKISWGSCGAADCTYDVKVLAPEPERYLAQGIQANSLLLEGNTCDNNYQFAIAASNKCGASEVCMPVLPPPKFTESCPT